MDSNPYEPPIARLLSDGEESISTAIRREALRGAWFGAKFIGLLVTIGSVLQWMIIAGTLAWVDGATQYFTLRQCVLIVGWQIAFGVPLSLVGALTGALYMGFGAVPRRAPRNVDGTLSGDSMADANPATIDTRIDPAEHPALENRPRTSRKSTTT